ncbi:MAG: hypothetical protein KUG74_06205 [Rhodobacteraceae bacterium]|nr:hypothetical protein [Paracoccaceae bacterium]
MAQLIRSVFRLLAPLAFVPVLGLFSGAAAQGPVRDVWQKLDKSMLVWGSFMAPSSVHSSDAQNAKFEIYAKPTIRLWQLAGKTRVNGYIIVAALRDKQKLDYNSKLKYAVGVELEHKLTPAVRLSFGAKWDTEYQYFSGTTYSALTATADLSVYKTWDPQWLRKGRFSDAQLVLSGWANLRYPGALDPSERHNGLAQGALKLAAVVPIGSGKLKIAPFLSLAAKADFKGRPWNNTLEPALGVDLKIPIGKRGVLSVGAKTTVQLRHVSGQVQSGGLAYLSWYKHF